MTVLQIAAVCLFDDAGHLVTVRKRGTSRFMLPGGKIEPGETALDAARREVAEELGVILEADDLGLLGEFGAAAANEPDTAIAATVFLARHALSAGPQPAAEIEQVRPLTPDDPLPDDLAPLLDRHVLPALTASRAR